MSDNRENKHNEEPHDSEEEKYSFLQETVKAVSYTHLTLPTILRV